MAILLGAFLIHGLVPGPDMLHKNLAVTYSMVWSVALANILGAGMCYAFSPQFAKIATMRYTLVLPAVLGIIYIGSFEASRNWGDLYALLFFGLVGWIMKQFKWPRPPMLLGAVLGDIIERYMFISVGRYGVEWMYPWNRPVVFLLLLMAFFGLIRPLLQDVKAHGGPKQMLTNFQLPQFRWGQLFTIFMFCVIAFLLSLSTKWPYAARVVPTVVGVLGLIMSGLSLLNEMCRKPEAAQKSMAEAAQDEVEQTQKIHMDISSDTAHLPISTIVGRAALFFGYMIAFMGSMATIGLIPTIPIFIIFFMRFEAQERWSLVVPYALCVTLFVYFAFDQFMAIPWPQTLLGGMFPELRGVIPSV
jgi:hypothetical protein